MTDFFFLAYLNHIVAVGTPAAGGGVVIFQLLDHLVSVACIVAAGQVVSIVAYSHHVLWGRGREPKGTS